jgi:hypothetical protein
LSSRTREYLRQTKFSLEIGSETPESGGYKVTQSHDGHPLGWPSSCSMGRTIL